MHSGRTIEFQRLSNCYGYKNSHTYIGRGKWKYRGLFVRTGNYLFGQNFTGLTKFINKRFRRIFKKCLNNKNSSTCPFGTDKTQFFFVVAFIIISRNFILLINRKPNLLFFQKKHGFLK